MRSEEDRQTSKSSRMKQHFGATRTKAQSNTLSVEDYVADDDIATAANYHPQKLEKQMAELQAQIASLKASLSSNQASAKPSKKPHCAFRLQQRGKSWTVWEEAQRVETKTINLGAKFKLNAVPVEGLPGTEQFPKEFVEVEPEVSTLVLVVPVLIGTNALDTLYEEHCSDKNPSELSSVYGYRQIIHILKLRNKVDNTQGG